jgi:hypothetical protein
MKIKLINVIKKKLRMLPNNFFLLHLFAFICQSKISIDKFQTIKQSHSADNQIKYLCGNSPQGCSKDTSL